MKLHPKHGLNPTMPVCFWCGKDKGDIILLGAAYKKEAPRKMLFDAYPCDACKDVWAQGIVFIEAEDYRTNEVSPPIKIEGVTIYPTGRLVCVKEDSDVLNAFNMPNAKEQLLETRKAFLTQEVFNLLFGEMLTAMDAVPTEVKH